MVAMSDIRPPQRGRASTSRSSTAKPSWRGSCSGRSATPRSFGRCASIPRRTPSCGPTAPISIPPRCTTGPTTSKHSCVGRVPGQPRRIGPPEERPRGARTLPSVGARGPAEPSCSPYGDHAQWASQRRRPPEPVACTGRATAPPPPGGGPPSGHTRATAAPDGGSTARRAATPRGRARCSPCAGSSTGRRRARSRRRRRPRSAGSGSGAR